ncbi:DUF6422 family protein [Embleya sp. NPDC001921]
MTVSGGKRKLTEEQQKVVDDAVTSVAEAYNDARSRVRAAGVNPDGGGGTPCRLCGCASFVLGGDGLDECNRFSPTRCGHDWGVHDVF